MEYMIKFVSNNSTNNEVGAIWHSLWWYLAQVLAIYSSVNKSSWKPSIIHTYNSPWIWWENIKLLEEMFQKGDLSEIQKKSEEQKALYTTESIKQKIDEFNDKQVQLAWVQIWETQKSAIDAITRNNTLEEDIQIARKIIKEKYPDIDLDQESANKFGMKFNELPDIRLQASLIFGIVKVLWWIALWTYVAWCIIKWKQEDYKTDTYNNVFNYIWEECPHLVTNTVFTWERIGYNLYIKWSISHSIKDFRRDIESMKAEDFDVISKQYKEFRTLN